MQLSSHARRSLSAVAENPLIVVGSSHEHPDRIQPQSSTERKQQTTNCIRSTLSVRLRSTGKTSPPPPPPRCVRLGSKARRAQALSAGGCNSSTLRAVGTYGVCSAPTGVCLRLLMLMLTLATRTMSVRDVPAEQNVWLSSTASVGLAGPQKWVSALCHSHGRGSVKPSLQNHPRSTREYAIRSAFRSSSVFGNIFRGIQGIGTRTSHLLATKPILLVRISLFWPC